MPLIRQPRRIALVIVEDDQLWHVRQIRRERIYREIAEHPSEGDLIARIDILVAKYQKLVLEKRTVHNAKLIRGEMLRQVKNTNLRPNRTISISFVLSVVFTASDMGISLLPCRTLMLR